MNASSWYEDGDGDGKNDEDVANDDGNAQVRGNADSSESGGNGDGSEDALDGDAADDAEESKRVKRRRIQDDNKGEDGADGKEQPHEKA